MPQSSESRESEEYARFLKVCFLMSSGTISDTLMLMNKRALSTVEITLFKVNRGHFIRSAVPCYHPYKLFSFVLDNSLMIYGSLVVCKALADHMALLNHMKDS